MNAGDVVRLKLEETRELLRRHEQTIVSATRNAENVRVQLATWEEAYRIVANGHSKTENAGERPNNTTRDSRRGPKGNWRDVMPEMVRQYPTGTFALVDVAAAGELRGFNLKPETVRSQMSNYVKAGFLDRINNGKFSFTDKGREMFASLLNKPS